MSSVWTELLGAEVKYYDAGGIRTRIIEAGEGRPILLLHGVTGSAETWVHNVHALAKHGRVMAMDMVGHGFTDKPDTNYLIPTFTDHLGAVIDMIGAEQVDLIGQSLGGWVTMRYALAHPDRVKTLTNVTGAGLAVRQSHKDLESYHSNLNQVTARALETPTRETVRKRLEWLFFDPGQVSEELVDIRYHIFTRPDTQAVMGRVMSDVIGAENQRYFIQAEELERFNRPVLVLWTTHNPTTPWPEGKAAAEVLPVSRFELFDDCAHWPQYEDHQRFNRIVGKFLSEEGA
jgi:2-hydroxy-6-oxonona-2,4-dienedioate hydrolase